MTRDDRPSDPTGMLAPELEDELATALRSAVGSSELDPQLNELLIGQALEDPLAAPTEDEQRAAAALRAALDDAGLPPNGADAQLAALLRAAVAPGAPSELAVERALRAALPRDGRSRALPVAAGVTATLLALAASVAIVVRSQHDDRAEQGAQTAELVTSRSTAALFHEKFEPAATSARVDRIALAHSRDLRANRYALWGVR